MGTQPVDLNEVYAAIHTLYSAAVDSNCPNSKQKASTWLDELQKSVYAWSVADQLLHRKTDLFSCYFGALTLRKKIQSSFHELPLDSHNDLRNSLIQHIFSISIETDQRIVTQLCLALTHLVLQASTWQDPVGDLLNLFGRDTRHWWPLLEIFTLLPEEMISRSLGLGENRRKEVQSIFESVSPSVFSFLQQCLRFCISGECTNSPSFSKEHCLISIVKCYGPWVPLNPTFFCASRNNELLEFTISQLKVGECDQRMHSAATESFCIVIEAIPDINLPSNNNSSELHCFELNMHCAVMGFEEAYHKAVADEDPEKVINYCRIFTEYGESKISHMLRSWRDPHYSIQVIDKILICDGHHDFEVAEITFGFWYRLTEELFHVHDESLNSIFRPYAQRLTICLYKHCQIEPDHEGLLSSSDDLFEFRRRVRDLMEELLFLVDEKAMFTELAKLFLSDGGWESREAALFLLYTIAKSKTKTSNLELVKPVLEAVLNWNDWRHACLKLTAVKFVGSISKWLNENPEENLEKCLNFLVSCLPQSEYSDAAASSLMSICDNCAERIAEKYMDSMLHLGTQMDKLHVTHEAAVGLLRGIGHVLAILPSEQLSHTIRTICWAQLEPLSEITNKNQPVQKGTKEDPIFLVDRLAAVFRNNTINNFSSRFGTVHPCQIVVCEDLWPVLSKVCDRFKEDSKIMERVCRCLRYSVRCVGKHSHPFLQPLVEQLVELYNSHPHSCFLYLASILVDEYAEEEQCVPGLLKMLAAFLPTTFKLLNEPQGFRNHPDTVEDFFRLCSRFLQRCCIPMLESEILPPILQCAIEGIQLDHPEANSSVIRFLYELTHSARRHKDDPKFDKKCALVTSILSQKGEEIISALMFAMIFVLRSYAVQEICDLLYELKEVMQDGFSKCLETALKKLPDKTASGTQAATLEQLESFHKQALNSRCQKSMYRAVKEFCRLFR